MFRKAAFSVVLLLQLLAAPSVAAEYQEGQVWSYGTRAGEEGSRLYIVRIDRELSIRPIFHIYVDGLKLKNPLMEGGLQEHLPHAPVDQETLDASVVELLQADASMPHIGEGYSLWREAFGQGRAGVFTQPVSEIVQHIENAFNAPK
jgi:hypothetical protein